ncbi:MAG: hypothetical protein JW891_17040 [Candidatus Lokiarchaeota archaeon]|nr:hypothetical protein [Candidatus Lokiarchaeota archaeon]
MSTAYVCSILFYFSKDVNLFVWKLFLTLQFANYECILLILSSLQQKQKKDLPFFSVFSIFFGIIIGGIISPISVSIDETLQSGTIVFNPSLINYKFQIHLSSAIILFCLFLIFVFTYKNISTHLRSRNKTFSKLLLASNITICIPLFFLIILAIVQLPILRDLQFVFLFFSYLFNAILFAKNPDLALNLTNKVYSINIYHKSGVLLYSYKFEYETPDIESAIWGNIVIGLNHIVGEFIDKKDQIDVLKTRSADIMVDYNNEKGFAVLVMTNRLNKVLSQMMHDFTKEFEIKFEEELKDIQDLNNLIDVSDFKGVDELIKKRFSIYF